VVETVVFVIVLVLMLKSYVAEAFVIPTGSMAETLYGYQKNVTCPQCDYVFPVNANEEVEKKAVIDSCICPNCRLSIKLVKKEDPSAPDEAHDPGVSTGDRVLVAKFLYELLGYRPDRFDTVVFKFPGDSVPELAKEGVWPRSGPQKNNVPMNYIKRLIGYPGEIIAIFYGDLYASPPDMDRYAAEDFQDCKDEASRRRRKLELWQHRYTHSQVYQEGQAYDSLLKQLQSDAFPIIRKKPKQIMTMKRIVFDNDHLPRDLKDDPESQRWRHEGSAGWVSADTSFRHEASGNDLGWLRYHHILRGHNKPTRITDFMGYNQGGSGDWVGDLILECEVELAGGEGEFVLELSRGVDRFRAHWNLGDGVCKLFRTGEAAPLASKDTALKGEGKHHVRFANVDRQLVVWVDDRLVFGEEGVTYPAPGRPGPDDANDLEPASIGIKGVSATIRHLRLWRDTHYTIPASSATRAAGGPGAILTMYVQPDHYLCLGDNSHSSADSRSWGLVPHRLLLGKAVMVYYPFKFPWWPLENKVNRIGLIE
jgi:signal peptidase I